tara:strand:- start:904 stop:1314 length:411 start_codon:yes stop_codon:yes gene_type:complete
MTIVLVDMSATIIHHGHIRLLKKASKIGSVTIALTIDEEILKYKGYYPELNFQERKEILESIKYVDNVIPSPWKLELDFFKNTGADFLIHGDDNKNDIPEKYLKLYKRTEGISSSIIREKVIKVNAQKNKLNNKNL